MHWAQETRDTHKHSLVEMLHPDLSYIDIYIENDSQFGFIHIPPRLGKNN